MQKESDTFAPDYVFGIGDESDKAYSNLLRRFAERTAIEEAERLFYAMCERYRIKVIAYFISKFTNAIAEGLNSMIQAAKRKARGYRTFEGFSSMIYLIAAKLQLACLNPLRLLK